MQPHRTKRIESLSRETAERSTPNDLSLISYTSDAILKIPQISTHKYATLV